MGRQIAIFIYLQVWTKYAYLSWLKNKKHFKVEIHHENLNDIFQKLKKLGYDPHLISLYDPLEVMFYKTED
jgi:hypothetical protein